MKTMKRVIQVISVWISLRSIACKDCLLFWNYNTTEVARILDDGVTEELALYSRFGMTHWYYSNTKHFTNASAAWTLVESAKGNNSTLLTSHIQGTQHTDFWIAYSNLYLTRKK